MDHSQGDNASQFGPGARPSGAVQVLDLLFPGFSILAQGAAAWGIDLGRYVNIAIGLGILSYVWSQVKGLIFGLLKKVLLSTAEIRADDVEVYNIVMSWIAIQPAAANSRRFFVSLDHARRQSPWRYDGDEHNDPVDSTLRFTPSYGTHILWYRGRPLLLTRSKGEAAPMGLGLTKRDEISLSCIGFSTNTLKQLLASAQADHLRKDHDKTVIYRGHMTVDGGANWSRATSRLSRPFNTIYTKAGLIDSIIDDIKDYLSHETKAWYASCGIPLRRGFLFCGPPGTGKSSLSFALAGHFGLKIYTVSLSSPGATEDNLSELFEVLPQSCIVLFEDVDAAGLTHTRAPKKSRRSRGSSTEGLSLSGLLNLLDGVASQEGRILIMTTNHAENLDKALLRPGRVDMTLEFGLADEYMTGAIFKGVFAHLHQKLLAKTGTDGPEIDTKQEAEAVKAKIEAMASDFSARIPTDEFSPAEIQGYLIRHRREPEAAVKGARDWVRDARKRRKEEEEEKLLRASGSGEPDEGAEEDEPSDSE
ncbi:BCS1 N terminal-domain-containing protein [Plectosphaerella plurivora]|uniref:BCS1 N terminal-domain-containing protein n=1 Tax=Plectosphaerella plurivora TaxID=936078 RepID=A0A9P8VJ16_9PEZI|nr:BCS1 N terminal-domain-containing protein [Plectosphaerella plurivora]